MASGEQPPHFISVPAHACQGGVCKCQSIRKARVHGHGAFPVRQGNVNRGNACERRADNTGAAQNSRNHPCVRPGGGRSHPIANASYIHLTFAYTRGRTLSLILKGIAFAKHEGVRSEAGAAQGRDEQPRLHAG